MLSALVITGAGGLPAVRSPVFGAFALIEVYTTAGFALMALGVAAIAAVALHRPRFTWIAGVLAFIIAAYVVWQITGDSHAGTASSTGEQIGRDLASLTTPLWGSFVIVAASLCLVAAAPWLERHPASMPARSPSR